jgi:glycosyltransferase involved in cell wall biosynthesis
MKSNPLITIVTVTFNAIQTIENTILSVIKQTYLNIEYIIIDGGSTDGTVDIIKKYEDKLAYWVSEPDKGIYNAMNKGIIKAIGEWILFLNCGDAFYSNTILNDIHEYLINTKADVVYGDSINLYSHNIRKKSKASDMKKIKSKMPFCHQSCFVRVKIARNNLFDLKYKICADYNLFYILYNNGYIFQYIPFVISNFSHIDGFAIQNEFTLLNERFIINTSKKTIVFYLRYGYALLRLFIRKILPSKLISLYRQFF